MNFILAQILMIIWTSIKEEALTALGEVKDDAALAACFAAYLAKKGSLSLLMGKMREIPPQEKAAFGQAVNQAKKEVEAAYAAKKEAMEELALEQKLASESIDVTLPGRSAQSGRKSPFYVVIDDVMEVRRLIYNRRNIKEQL